MLFEKSSGLIVLSGCLNSEVCFNILKGNKDEAMKESGGKALMGTGEGEGTSRAVEAAENAITSPLLEDISIELITNAGANGGTISDYLESVFFLINGEQVEVNKKDIKFEYRKNDLSDDETKLYYYATCVVDIV